MNPADGHHASPVKEGSVAPDFTTLTDEGTPLTLSSLRGRNVVLYFYPKDDTPGCTAQACGLRDDFPRFRALDAVVLGVSPDDVKSHQKFKRKYDLPFTLLADPDHAIAERYGVWQEKSLFGKKYWGVARTTYIIDRAGKVARIFEKVKPQEHADDVAAALHRIA